jgi:menaquinone-dependent protoporphyrinogen IX oxidase
MPRLDPGPRPAGPAPRPATEPATPVAPSSPALPGGRRVLVLFDSRFGNTQRVAEALARGLAQIPGVGAECRPIAETPEGRLREYDLIAIGGPTEILSASKPMKAFLERLPGAVLQGRRAFAFETKLDGHLSGSAGKFIERRLKQLGMEIVRPHATAIVRGMTKAERAAYGDLGAPDWVRRVGGPGDHAPVEPNPRLDLLAVGAVPHFEAVGRELGSGLKPVPAAG